MEVNKDRTVNVLWADEVRQEEGGKLSIIGLYATNLDVERGATLKQLYAFVEVTTPVDRPFKSLRFVATSNGKEVLNLSLPEAAMDAALAQIKELEADQDDSSPGEPRVAMRAGLPFSGITVAEPTTMRLSVTTEEGEMTNTAILHLRPRQSK
ncbi:hypothetical protein [Cupriavidus taiwanensis]|uniref:hypothetical protein n=1 Tax=Cupriavidus taiwanensis TaxID=164546 RepID=UPI0039C0D10A